MPKKFRGENSKAVEARARKAAQKDAETERKQRELEDEYWKEDDKHVLKKLQRKVCTPQHSCTLQRKVCTPPHCCTLVSLCRCYEYAAVHLLNSVKNWSDEWLLRLNIDKCKTVSYYVKNPISTQYHIIHENKTNISINQSRLIQTQRSIKQTSDREM